MKRQKAPGNDGITTDVMKIEEPEVIKYMTKVYNYVLKKIRLGETCGNSPSIKKDIAYINENYVNIIENICKGAPARKHTDNQISDKSTNNSDKKKDPGDRLRWVGRLDIRKDNKWTKRCTEWQPRSERGDRGRLEARWMNDIWRIAAEGTRSEKIDGVYRGPHPAVDGQSLQVTNSKEMNTRGSRKRQMEKNENTEQSYGKKLLPTDDVRLAQAVVSGDISAVTNLLQNKTFEYTKFDMRTVFLKAVEGGKKRIVQLLFNHGVDISGSSKTGSLALIAAAGRGYFDIVKMIVRMGVGVDGQDQDGKTALMMAVEKSCCSSLISYLMDECEADADLQDSAGNTALMLAVKLWDYGTVQLLMGSKGFSCDTKVKNNAGETLLDMAAQNGSTELLKCLLHSQNEGIPALHHAVGQNKPGLVKQLIELDPTCVNGYCDQEEPTLAAVMVGVGADEWDGTIHCSCEMLDLLLQAGVHLVALHSCGLSPLMLAASAGFEDGVLKLLCHEAEVDQRASRHENSQTALMFAAEKGHSRIVDLLLQAGASPDKEDENGDTALRLAINGGCKDCMKSLLKHVANLAMMDLKLMEETGVLHVLIEVEDRWEQLFEPTILGNILCMAIKSNSKQLVVSLLKFGVDVNASYEYDSTYPLMLAMKDIDMLRLLLDRGADVNVRKGLTDYTALMQAAIGGKVPQVKLLIQYNADLYIEAHGQNAITLASLNRGYKVIETLLDGGMDVNHVTSTGKTALYYALSLKNFVGAKTLIQRGANVNITNSEGSTALMNAVRKCTSNFAELLIKHGADINAQDENGDTALFHALRHSITREDKVSLLLKHGADYNHVNLQSKTPLMVAARFCHANVMKLLLSYGSNINAQDNDSNTALHEAVQYSKDVEKLKLLVGHGADMNIANIMYEVPLMLAVNTLKSDSIKTLIELGAGLYFPNSRFITSVWHNDLDRMLERCNRLGPDGAEFSTCLKCLEILLEAGCPLHGTRSSNRSIFLNTCISADARKTVFLLLKSGIEPNLLDLSSLPPGFPISYIVDAVSTGSYNASPLCTAILFARAEIVSFFAQACFFHQRDVKMLQHPTVMDKLEKLFGSWSHKTVSPMEELSPINWSLRTWSKLTISRAVGFSRDREERVRALPLPQAMRDEFLFRNINLPVGFDASCPSSPSSGLGLDFRD
ncbi:tkl protein kinase [Plakobranchus ocellatus]|uniref:Tkl protein kinase n=1 Tax=Plakobranchus ocellatus TaxID=259542 RepID=A0AAV3ZQV0_9GAST|nr:tkl protein kinase [Plakobranchus ocellatus]